MPSSSTSKLDDTQGAASDFYSYGIFLRDSGFPPRLAYVCFLKAQSLMQKSTDTAEFNSIALAREGLEKKLAAQSAELRRNPDSALREALAVTLP